ncbi:MAG: type IIL restriction-modification enzyme MmeI [Polyangiales bacterium]
MRRHGSNDPLLTHRAWIGLVQPDGIVVSPAALVDAGLAPDPLTGGEVDALRHLCGLAPSKPREREVPEAPRFLVHNALARLFTEVLGCDPAWIHGTEAQPFEARSGGLERVLPEFNAEVLAPTYALRNPNAAERHRDRPWLCLLKELPRGWSLDRPHGEHSDAHWAASPMAKFERLLRETDVPIGVIGNDEELRVLYAPPGEGAGVMAFPVEVLLGAEGDAVMGALVMLLGRARWFDNTPDEPGAELDRQFLPRVLAESRRYQNNVSTKLSAQVLDALWELLRGLQAAHDASGAALLRDWITAHPDEIYGALLAVLLRLVFLLYAEDRDQLPAEGFYPASYGVRSLYEKLRDDEGRHPDTMALRQGAWARLLATFRLVHQGGGHGDTALPPREGALFSPDTHPLLEGRPRGSAFQPGQALDAPAISDRVVLRVLERLLRVDKEDLSYKTLGVEELGSVYESIMGFTVETTAGRSLALKPDDVVVDLDALLRVPGDEREKWLKARADVKLTGKGVADAVRAAKTVDAMAEALSKARSERTAAVMPAGSLVLQPTEERRRSGSHYTPRTLTGPIVEKTLAPVLAARSGRRPRTRSSSRSRCATPPWGAGPFSWPRAARSVTASTPRGSATAARAGAEVAKITPDVDENPFAVDLARLSLWLETLAKEHPFTFLDHALRDGDSLVGATRDQIGRLSLEEPVAPKKAKKSAQVQVSFLQGLVREGVTLAVEKRAAIRALALSDDTAEKRRLLDDARHALGEARLAGDALVATFFGGRNPAERKARLKALHDALDVMPTPEVRKAAFEGAARGLGLRPFHWELEFPEVFTRENPGFDCVVGNPPFLGGSKISTNFGDSYLAFLLARFEGAIGTSDYVAFFFRAAFELIRRGGTVGLVATNTIAQGDTRQTGLSWICRHGGRIFDAVRRYPWPGMAAVVVSVVLFSREHHDTQRVLPRLDGRPVSRISAFLFNGGSDEDPVRLASNDGMSFGGVKIYGQGFVLTPDERERHIVKNPANSVRIFPYLGGEELNSHPRQMFDRYVISFGTMTLDEASRWPDLLQIVEERVKPERDRHTSNEIALRQKEYWWRYRSDTPRLREAIQSIQRCLANSQVSAHFCFAWQPVQRMFSQTLNVFASDQDSFFAVMQSHIHEIWVRFFASSLEERLRYTPSDCFETFPFPKDWRASEALESIGRRYYEHRAELMVRDESDRFGLTELYNRFHDPHCDDAGIVRLRALHEEMDRAVLAAYGWQALAPTYAFIDEQGGDDEDEAAAGAKTKRRRVRYRWPDELRDDVLARLIALNAERAAEEAEARRRAEEEAAKAKAEAEAREKRNRMKLVPKADETVGEALRAYFEKEGLTVETYCERFERSAAVVECVLASKLPFDAKDLSTTALALKKESGGDDTAYFEVLSHVERDRLPESRRPVYAEAARRKGETDEP